MDTNELYERWRQSRSQVDPARGFSDRVMDSIGAHDLHVEPAVKSRRISGMVQAGVCAAAALVALFRVVELFNLLAASRLEN